MALISLRQLLDHAAENDYGMPAFNVNNMEQVHAIMQAADETNSPVIMQGSAGARSYAGEPFLRHLIAAAIEMYPHIPVVMHQDHGSEPAVCLRSIQSGFSSVMMDGSLEADMKTPASFEYNVAVTKEVVKWLMRVVFQLKVNSVAWVLWKPVKWVKKMVTAQKVSWTWISC